MVLVGRLDVRAVAALDPVGAFRFGVALDPVFRRGVCSAFPLEAWALEDLLLLRAAQRQCLLPTRLEDYSQT